MRQIKLHPLLLSPPKGLSSLPFPNFCHPHLQLPTILLTHSRILPSSVPMQIHSYSSQSTITKGDDRSTDTSVQQREAVNVEEEMNKNSIETARSITPSNPTRIPPHPTRTPARTKCRSVSTLSDGNGSPAREIPLAALPPQDFASLLSTPAPIIFSTPAERELLNTMSAMDFDTAQIVHSAICDACDSTGALWWMLMRKHEKRIIHKVRATSPDPVLEQVDEASGSKRRKEKEGDRFFGTRKKANVESLHNPTIPFLRQSLRRSPLYHPLRRFLQLRVRLLHPAQSRHSCRPHQPQTSLLCARVHLRPAGATRG
jgi:hypothetical protein